MAPLAFLANLVNRWHNLRLPQVFARNEERGSRTRQYLRHACNQSAMTHVTALCPFQRVQAPAACLRRQRPFDPTSTPSPLPGAGRRPPRFRGQASQRLVPSLLVTLDWFKIWSSGGAIFIVCKVGHRLRNLHCHIALDCPIGIIR